MLIRNAILASLNRVLGLRNLELRSRVKPANDCSMDAALRRAGGHFPRIGTVIDVGAAAGKWTRRALPHFPDARHLLIEPLHERIAELEALRAAHPRVEFVSAVAGAEAGEATLQVAPDLDGSGVSDGGGRTVPVTTLDREISQRGLPPPYFIKLDTHGYEIPILEGARAALAQTELLMIEVYNFRLTAGCLRFPQMCAHLEAAGFLPCDAIEPFRRPGDGVLWQMDLVFARKDAPFFLLQTYG